MELEGILIFTVIMVDFQFLLNQEIQANQEDFFHKQPNDIEKEPVTFNSKRLTTDKMDPEETLI